MPYIVKGLTVYKRENGLKKVGRARNKKTLRKYLAVLHMVEEGRIPRRKKRRKRKKS